MDWNNHVKMNGMEYDDVCPYYYDDDLWQVLVQ